MLWAQARDISIEEFKRSELLNNFNSLLYEDLLLISNRNIHLKSIHDEFLKFSNFITKPLNRDHFLVFLTPVFQHLYLLLLSQKGKPDAEKFASYYRHLPFQPNVLDELLNCKTCVDAQILIKSQSRIRVKLSSYAYRMLMNWLRDSFSKTSEMFNVLRVLHENFHLDIYHDKDDEEFAAVECQVLEAIQEWLTNYNAENGEKKSESKVAAETCETPESDDDVMIQKMSELDIVPETAEISETSEIPKTSKKPETSEMPKSFGSDCELKSSMFKLKDSARRYLEKVRKSIKEEDWTLQQIEEALLNPPDLNDVSPSEMDDQKMDLHEGTASVADENAGKDEKKIGFLEDAALADERYSKELIEMLVNQEAGAAARLLQKFSKFPLNASDVENILTPGLSPFGLPPSHSSGASEYMIVSEDSTESKFISPFREHEEEDTETEENVDYAEQGPNYVKYEDVSEEEENVEEDTNADNKVHGQDEENKNKLKPQYFEFKKSYKSNFHSVYPVNISGKDVLCSSDVSSDLNYMACSFENCKICTWHLGENFKMQPIGTLTGHKGIVYALSIDANRKTLISGSHDCTVRIWDIEESKCVYVISAHSAPVYAVCASPNSKYFLSASEDKHIILTFYDDIYPFRVYSGHSQEAINCVRFHPNCAYFASASSDGNLFLFKINEDRPVRMFTKHVAKVYTLSFSPCGKNLASADVDGILIIWDILTCTPIKTFETRQGIRTISYDTSGSLIAAIFYYKSWKIYNIAEDNVEENNVDVVIEAECVGVPRSVHFSEDNKMLVIQYIEADKNEIADTKEKPKTTIIN